MTKLTSNPRKESEKDLGVYISPDLGWKKQVQHMCSKANRVLGMLKKTFTCRDLILWRSLYISLVRPHLEYASSVWNSLLKGEQEAIEKVQRRATKIPSETMRLPYEEWLVKWNLTTLAVRRVRGDMIQLYKALNGFEKFEWHTGPKFDAPGITRAASLNSLRQKGKFPDRGPKPFLSRSWGEA